ncbi:MAG: CAP domain-containing protein [Pyrinomonadaceae bacterium]
MKSYPKTLSVNQFLFFVVIFFAFALSVSAQISGTDYAAKSLDNSRPRIVETDKKTITVSSKSAFYSFDLEKQAFNLLNSQRAAKGLTALEWNDDIARIARMHSENMAKYKFFSHTGLDGLMVNDRADLCGVSRWKAIGENIAYNRGYEKPAEFAVERWMQSNSHRENILNNRWKESAVGVAMANDGSFYFTQVFLVRK